MNYKSAMLAAFSCLFSAGFGWSQCPFNNNFHADMTPSAAGVTVSDNCINGGDLVTVSVVAGEVYTFSTCNNDPFSGWDSQITLYDATGTNAIDYSDDACDLFSEIVWLATYTGTVNVMITEYDCASNTDCLNFEVTRNGPPPCSLLPLTPLCTSGIPIPMVITGVDAVQTDLYNNWDCVEEAPNAVLYYLEVGTSGDIEMTLTGSADDIDYVIWGPFPDLAAAESSCGSWGRGGAYGDAIDCGYSTGLSEYPEVLGATTGEIYVMSVSNYNGTPQDFTLTQTGGTGALVCQLPEMDVTGNSVAIASGDNTPDANDFTSFGNILTCSGSISKTFIIENSGGGELSLTGTPLVSITGPQAADFTVTTPPTTPVAPGATTSFTITFNPGASGVRQATVTIANDDSDENPYSFSIEGVGDADVTAPVPDVTSLPNISNSCSANLTAPTATDNCAGSITATTTDPTSYTAQGNYTVTWTYDDGNGNTSTQTQTVTINDATAPVPDAASLPNISNSCSANLTAPTATDNCAGTITGTTTDPTSYTAQGNYTVTWTYDDGNGNTSTQTQTVTIDDATAPVPDAASLPNATGDCSVNLTAPTATDNCAGAITGTTTDPTSYTAQGNYTVTWTYDDGNGNTSTQTQTVTINDATAPVPDAASLPNATGDCSVNLTAPTATDACTGSITGTTTDPTSYTAQGNYTVTWTYDDGQGNIATQTQTILVDDATAPVPDVAGLPDLVGCSVTVSGVPTASDNCSGTVNGTTTDPLVYNTAGNYTVTWSYSDGHGNTSTQTQSITVVDCSGVDEQTGEWGVSLYPNPSDGMISLNIAKMPEGTTTVRIVDMLGKVWMTKQLTGGLSAFDLQHLPAALYYMQINNAGRQVVIPFIIN